MGPKNAFSYADLAMEKIDLKAMTVFLICEAKKGQSSDLKENDTNWRSCEGPSTHFTHVNTEENV